MFESMPSLGALMQRSVVFLFAFLNQALQTDVAGNLKPFRLEEKSGEQSGNPAISVAERMNTEKVEDARSY